ncbi:hypothetical protein WR25_08499 [Diploscapter pachys]|uniref:SGNH domain-containing protein n=1 Tax=Diploscapter pachys TaxID=2018661 RepID=A0A2A2LFF8_9BILA|nr:hypothetical protein WR25_08499 [Diploscapter pachys]
MGKAPFNKSKPIEEDPIYQQHLKKLKYFESAPYLKKIYILTAFPSCIQSCAQVAIDWLKNEHKPLKEVGEKFVENDDEYGRARYEALVKNCKKCEVIDYKDILRNEDGKFTMYDDRMNVMYQDNVGHFNVYGRERIKPVYEKLAKKFAEEFVTNVNN